MPAVPLSFAPPALHDAAAARHAARASWQSDLAFANMYLLRCKYDTEIAFEESVLFRYFGGETRLRGYAFPCGAADAAAALRRVEEDAVLRGRALRFCLLTEEQCAAVESVFPGRFRFVSDPGDADYIYERSQLVDLPGARFHRKRNHVERFVRAFPDWRVEPLSEENASAALAVADAWLAGMESSSPALFHEREAIAHALHHMGPLSLRGAVLYVGELPVAMAVASLISDEVADVHYEKCHPDFRAAYPLINRELAALLPCPFINREEDLNHLNLRQAKLSYFPFRVLSKFSAVPC